MDEITARIDNVLSRIKKVIYARFSLRIDQADDGEIDQNIRQGIELNGTYLWTLMCAILIASIGLNVNSTAVIIGAMLISPLMGPIMGVGYGVGIYDFRLIQKALKNLAIATIISFATSALYFYLSPLGEAQSELLARTSPTIWDLLIATFGGLAGIIGITRKQTSNVIPGVAIATALMPPLCTAAYGFVHGNMSYFLGASYLYLLNCIYIALSSILIIWFIKPISQREITEKFQLRLKFFLLSVVFISCIPSIFIAANFVQSQTFQKDVSNFVSNEFAFDKTFSIDFKSSFKDNFIEVILVGKELDAHTIEKIKKNLSKYNLSDTKLVIKQIGIYQEDINALKTSIVKDILQDKTPQVEKKTQILENIQAEAESAKQNTREDKKKIYTDIAYEIYLQYPQVHKLYFADAFVSQQKDENEVNQIQIVIIVSQKTLKKDIRQKIEKWLKYRFKTTEIQIIFINQ